MKVIKKASEIGSGAPIENAVKTYVSLAQMKAALNANGIDTTSDPRNIAEAWNKWSTTKGNRDNYIVARDNIEANNQWI